LRSYHYHAGLDLKNFAFLTQPRVLLPRATRLRKFCVRSTTTREWNLEIFYSYHYHADHYHARVD